MCDTMPYPQYPYPGDVWQLESGEMVTMQVPDSSRIYYGPFNVTATFILNGTLYIAGFRNEILADNTYGPVYLAVMADSMMGRRLLTIRRISQADPDTCPWFSMNVHTVFQVRHKILTAIQLVNSSFYQVSWQLSKRHPLYSIHPNGVQALDGLITCPDTYRRLEQAWQRNLSGGMTDVWMWRCRFNDPQLDSMAPRMIEGNPWRDFAYAEAMADRVAEQLLALGKARGYHPRMPKCPT